MTEPAWRYVYASVRGTAHLEIQRPCQDFSLARLAKNSSDEPLLLLAVSDGAGSAARSEEGSRLACEEALKLLEHRFVGADARPSADLGLEVVRQTRHLLVNRAEELACELRDLACTLSVAVVLPTWAWFLQVGDGAMVVQERRADELPGDFRVMFWPDNGEYANQTYFVTDVPDAHIHSACVLGAVDRVAVITDGLQTLALGLAERRAHAPFFLPVFGTLEAVGVHGDEARRTLEGPLAQFLDSGPINARTNDDKTLLLASRMDPVPTEPGAIPAEPAATPHLDPVPLSEELSTPHVEG